MPQELPGSIYRELTAFPLVSCTQGAGTHAPRCNIAQIPDSAAGTLQADESSYVLSPVSLADKPVA
jgi:hypothetical protein